MISGEPASGITCPRCGGAIWEDADADAISFHCRIGDEFSLAEMLAEHGTRRRQMILTARRIVAESAALNRHIAEWARTHGHYVAASALDGEADALTRAEATLARFAANELSLRSTDQKA
jgi:two-component system chemotaxis response regulator CheB